MGQFEGCLKYILFVFNFLLWLLGCALLSVGIWMKVDEGAKHYVERMTDHVDNEYQISYSAIGETDVTVTIAYLLIVFGLILIVVTFIGCCGAVRENACMLIIFAVCLFALIVALVSVGIWAYVRRDDIAAYSKPLRAATDSNIKRGVEKYHSNDGVSAEFMDTIQEKLRCCGGKNHEDYGKREFVPHSCEQKTLPIGCEYPYFRYVGNEIEEFLEHRYTAIAGISFGAAVCLALGMVVTLLMCCMVRRGTVLSVN